jgi:hypothetical protein
MGSPGVVVCRERGQLVFTDAPCGELEHVHTYRAGPVQVVQHPRAAYEQHELESDMSKRPQWAPVAPAGGGASAPQGASALAPGALPSGR